MSGTRTPARRRIPTAWWVAIAAAAVVAVLVIVIVATAGSGGGASPTGSPATGSTPPGGGVETDAAAPPATDGGQTPAPENPPVGLDAEAPSDIGVVFTISGLESVDGEAQGPGEVAGPAVKFTVVARNDTAADVDLSATVVNVYHGADQTPADQLSGNGSSPLPASVAAGSSVEGVYVYSVPADRRDQLKITVDYRAGSPVVVFEGAGPS